MNLPLPQKCWRCILSRKIKIFDEEIQRRVLQLRKLRNNLVPRLKSYLSEVVSKDGILITKRSRYFVAAVIDFGLIAVIVMNAILPAARLLTPLISPLQPLTAGKGGYEVFGFAPYWTFSKLDNVNFNVLTTFAYFGIPVNDDGNLDKSGVGYQTFQSKKATDIFQKAHASGTRVVLTLTQMDNGVIQDIMDNPEAQNTTINQAVAEVKNRGIDGINVDFEYQGDPGQAYRDKFTKFIGDLTARMHQSIPQSKVTVSVYASAMKDPKIYEIGSLAGETDGIFMMAYDFAVASSDNAIPTDPLYGHKDGKYWYDISTAVADFLKVMPSDKLILGVPYYGYNYAVTDPSVKAATLSDYWSGDTGNAQMYSYVSNNINSKMDGVDKFVNGWDSEGEVGYKAYHLADSDTWRMVFLDDPKSLGIKYDFAKSNNLKGVGIWALGFDSGSQDLWNVLAEKFGTKYADSSVFGKIITQVYADDGTDN